MKSSFVIIFSTAYLLITPACKKFSSQEETSNHLAKVGDKFLSYNDIEGYASGANSPQDSIAILKGYVNSWIKDQLLVREAEQHISEDFNIEKLVQDYKSSLILYNYVEELVAKELDTIVTDAQVEEYYQNNKQQYILSESIVKYQYAKLNKDLKSLKEFEKRWKNEDSKAIADFCAKSCDFYQMTEDFWKPASELLAIVPSSQLKESDLKKQGSMVKTDKDYKYYVKVIDFVGKEDVPPLEYIKGKIASVILNDRKQELIKRKKQILFDKFYNTSNVQSFIE